MPAARRWRSRRGPGAGCRAEPAPAGALLLPAELPHRRPPHQGHRNPRTRAAPARGAEAAMVVDDRTDGRTTSIWHATEHSASGLVTSTESHRDAANSAKPHVNWRSPRTANGPADVDQWSRPRIDLDRDSIRTVIWATGYRPDHRWIDLPVLDHQGMIHRDGGPVRWAPDTYVLGPGLTVLRRRGTSFIGGQTRHRRTGSAPPPTPRRPGHQPTARRGFSTTHAERLRRALPVESPLRWNAPDGFATLHEAPVGLDSGRRPPRGEHGNDAESRGNPRHRRFALDFGPDRVPISLTKRRVEACHQTPAMG